MGKITSPGLERERVKDAEARLDFRISPQAKGLIEQAAALQDMTVSEFAKSTLADKAKTVIEQHETRILSDRDRDVFLSLLDAPAAPNEALRAAAARFREAVEAGTLIP